MLPMPLKIYLGETGVAFSNKNQNHVVPVRNCQLMLTACYRLEFTLFMSSDAVLHKLQKTFGRVCFRYFRYSNNETDGNRYKFEFVSGGNQLYECAIFRDIVALSVQTRHYSVTMGIELGRLSLKSSAPSREAQEGMLAVLSR
jgi:hypothetical protein